MAETMITRDGKLHVLVGSTRLESIVREYAGDQPADEIHRLIECDAYEEARAETDLGSYEASLEHWRRAAQDWADEIELKLQSSRPGLRAFLEELLTNIKNEL